MQLAPPAALSSWLFKVDSPPKHPDLVRDHTQTPRHSDRCPLSTQSQRTWGLEENIRAAENEERPRRKDTGDWYPGFGKQRRRKATEGKKKRGGTKRETCVGLFDSGASTKETSRGKIDGKSKRLSRDERKEGVAWERSNRKRWRQTIQRSLSRSSSIARAHQMSDNGPIRARILLLSGQKKMKKDLCRRTRECTQVSLNIDEVFFFY